MAGTLFTRCWLGRRLCRRAVTIVRADQLRVADRLAGGGALGVRFGGETISRVDTGTEGGYEVVYVNTRWHPRWCWCLEPASAVTIYGRGGA